MIVAVLSLKTATEHIVVVIKKLLSAYTSSSSVASFLIGDIIALMSCWGGVRAPVVGVGVCVGVGGGSGGGIPRCTADDGDPVSSSSSSLSVSCSEFLVSSSSSVSGGGVSESDVASGDVDGGTAASAHRQPFSSLSSTAFTTSSSFTFVSTVTAAAAVSYASCALLGRHAHMHARAVMCHVWEPACRYACMLFDHSPQHFL